MIFMKDFSNEIVHLTKQIADAEKIVIYGAKQTAREILPVCEMLSSPDRILVAVTRLYPEDSRFLEGYPVQEAENVNMDKQTLVIVAMCERYYSEISQMPWLRAAGCILYVNIALAMEAKRYAAIQNLKRLGLDLRLFDRLYARDIFAKSDISNSGYPSIAEKMWELATEESARYVIQHMRNARAFIFREEYHAWLKEKIRSVQTDNGMNFEFGVARGDSLQVFAGGGGINRFYGFDSFEGLPEDWFSKEQGGLGKGTFRQDSLPFVPENTELIKGWFDESLPAFVSRADIQGKTADFIHIDCDLYASARTVFQFMAPFIKKGTILAFDEYINYPGWQMDEFRAFQEYVQAYQVKYEYLSFVERGCQVCVRVL